MKTLLLIITLLGSVCNSIASDYNTEMRTSIAALMAIDDNPNQYLSLAKKFESLSHQSKEDWLPPYYAALSNVWAAFSNDNTSKTDSILDHSTALLDRAEALGGDKSELYCLRSMVASARIMVDPLTRGMKYARESSDFIEKAKKANPNNPRVYFVKAQSLIFTPEMFGGGCKSAVPLADEAISKYKTFKPKSELSPNWGKDECIQLQKGCE
jgi:hypothetical protein